MEDFLNLAGVVCDIIMGQQGSFGSTSRTRRINDDVGLFICKVIRQGWCFCSFRPGILIDDELSDVSRQVLRFGMTVPVEQVLVMRTWLSESRRMYATSRWLSCTLIGTAIALRREIAI